MGSKGSKAVSFSFPKKILFTLPPPLCLSIDLKHLSSGPCPPVDGRKEDVNTSPRLYQKIFARLKAILLCFLTSPCLCSTKELGIQTQIGWLF